MTQPFILASASPRRLALLAQIGLTPQRVESADIDETPHKDELPEHYAKRMAVEKASVIALRFPEALVLAADTVVHCGRRILPKTLDEETVRKCLNTLSGRRHRVMTAVAIVKGGNIKIKAALTRVRFKHLSHTEINDYIAGGEWEGKAGGYAIQGRAAGFIPDINGSYSNVVGLPLCEVKGMLEASGIR
jgi:septum formation protein